jgi:hypothetical protein
MFADFWQRKSKKSFLLVSFLGLWLFPFLWCCTRFAGFAAQRS